MNLWNHKYRWVQESTHGGQIHPWLSDTALRLLTTGGRASLFFPSFFPVPLVLAAVTAPCWRDFLFVTQNKIPVSWYCFQQLQVSAFIAIYKKSTFDLKCHSLQQMHFQVSGPLFNSAWMVENQLKICWTAGERLLRGSTEGPERPFCSLPTIKGGLLERWKGTF